MLAKDVCFALTPWNDSTSEQKWERIRAYRNQLLSEISDYAMLPDAPPYDQATVDAIAEYRQALRDIPQMFTNPDDVIFPDKPEGL